MIGVLFVYVFDFEYVHLVVFLFFLCGLLYSMFIVYL